MKALSRRPNSLQEVAGEIIWNPEQQGVLLIVAAEQTYGLGGSSEPFDTAGLDLEALAREKDAEADEEGKPQLPPRTRPGLRLSSLEAYFNRRVVPCGDVTVLAPATMTVLNYKNLPEPSATLGMSPSDCFRLLQSTLTEAQWRKLSSPAGLGYSDMVGNQAGWFRASLPQRMTARYKIGDQEKNIPVSAAQRQGIRLHLFHQMDWSYSLGRNSEYPQFASDTEAIPQLTVDDSSETAGEDWERKAFGGEVVSHVPAHAKPGDLAYDDARLDATVSLNGLTTVGELVDRVRAETKVEVYADERYGRLPILIRGSQARAGNLLKACARAITGTCRKVGPAYVLTDDLIGLAVRHQKIYDWIQTNRGLAAQSEAQIAHAFDTLQPENLIGYDPADPLAPNQETQDAYAAYDAELHRHIKKDGTVGNLNNRFSVRLLTPRAQEVIRMQIAEIRQKNEAWAQGIQDDVVILFRRSRFVWDVPGLGVVQAPYEARLSLDRDAWIPDFSPQPVPRAMKVRAVFLSQGSVEQFAEAAAVAKQAGFTEVWAEASADFLDNPDLLAQRVRQAKQAGLALRVVIHGARSSGAERSKLTLNVLGETFTEYVARMRGALTPEGGQSLSAIAQKRGDWLDPETPERNAHITEAVAKIAAVPDLAGIVLSDLTPPGFHPPTRHPSATGIIRFPGLQTGYSESRRLAFLRRFHSDPIDIAIILGRTGFDTSAGRYRNAGCPELELPFLGSEMGYDWYGFLNDSSEVAFRRLQASLTKTKIPVWYYNNYLDAPDTRAFVENRDRGVAVAPKPEATPDENDDLQAVTLAPSREQRVRSSVLLNALNSVALAQFYSAPKRDWFATAISYQFDPKNAAMKKWDGLLLDMTDESLLEALAHLRQLPSP